MLWKRLELTEDLIGERIDKVISKIPEIKSRSRAHYLIEHNLVHVNQKPCKMSYLVKSSDIIDYQIPEITDSKISPYDIPIDIEYEDQDLLVIHKPAGLVVHPSAGHHGDTLVNALVAKGFSLSMKFGEDRPGIVHRLDKETSGLIVVAKNDLSHEKLALQFKNRDIHRIYQALVFGEPRPLKSTISSYLARHPNHRKKYASLLDQNRKRLTTPNLDLGIGKWAVTHYQTLESINGFSLVQLKLETGRTHQIRVHLSEAGYPIVGDSLYGADRKIVTIPSQKTQEQLRSLKRFYLHAAELGFRHPRTHQQLFFKRSWPEPEALQLRIWGFHV